MQGINFDQSNSSLLAQVFQNAPTFMALVEGPEFVFRLANQKYLELVGNRDIIGKGVNEILPEVEKQGFIDLLAQVWESKKPFQGIEAPVYLQNADGKTNLTYLDFNYQPILSDHGQVVAILVQGADVTEKVKARLELEHARDLVENERVNFRNLFKKTPELVCIMKGPEHLFEFVNDSHIAVLGFDATGMTVRQAQPESVEVHGLLDDVYTNGETVVVSSLPVTIGTKTKYFNLTYAPRHDVAGKINGVMIMATEVTTHIELSQEIERSKQTIAFERHKLDSIFNISPAAMAFWKGEELVFENVNLAYQDIFQDRQLTGRTLEEACPELKGQPFPDILRSVLRTGKPYVGTEERAFVRRQADGPLEERYYDFSYVQIKDPQGNPHGVYDHAIDVTDRVLAQKQLRVAKEEAERANALKSDFLANMSHEIRTPLGAMMGFADLLRDPEVTAEERANYVEVLLRNGQQLTVIINDILDLSKVEAGHLEIEHLPIKLDPFMTDILALMKVKADEKNLKLVYDKDPSTSAVVVSDPVRVRQVLLNLISNAIKFTKQGEVRVTSRCFVDVSGKNRVSFDVSDSGIGIPKEQFEKIFEVFVQADNSVTRRFGGTGLGLSLSRKLARLLGGDVSIKDSVLNKGSTFTFSFEDSGKKAPLQVDGVLENGSFPDKRHLEGVKVLIVDDTPDNQKLISHLLKRAGGISETAVNGKDAQDRALNGDYDVVLMDIQMPEMDGYTATKKLRERGYKKPIIALTAHAMAEVRSKCLAAGYTDHLTKPIDPTELIEVIRRHS